MTVTPLGILTVGAFAKSTALAVPAALSASADLNASLSASVSASASISAAPPSAAVLISALTSIIANLQVTPPSFGVALGVQTSLQASLTAKLAIQAPVVALNALLSLGGLYAYGFNGTVGNFGGELSGAIASIGPPSGSLGQGIAIVVTDPVAFAALSQVVKVA